MRAIRKQEKLDRKLAEKHPTLYAYPQDSISESIKTWAAILNDTTQSDSLKAVAKENVRELLVTRLKMNPNFNVIEAKYGNLPDSTSWEDLAKQVTGIDSVKAVFEHPSDLLDYSAAFAEQQLANMADMKSLTSANRNAICTHVAGKCPFICFPHFIN